jgi:hypothetical protein
MKWFGRRRSSGGGVAPDGGVAAGGSAGAPGGWWWCFDHKRAENPPDSPGNRRLGPYGSRAEAEHWRERLDARNEKWDEDDARWSGDRA